MGHEGEWKWINSGQTIADFVWQTGEQRLSLLNLIKFTTIQENQMKELVITVCIGQLVEIKLMIFLVTKLLRI